jgi:hypothetical protein
MAILTSIVMMIVYKNYDYKIYASPIFLGIFIGGIFGGIIMSYKEWEVNESKYNNNSKE